MLIDPLRVADGKNLRRVCKVRRHPFRVLTEAIMGKRKLARQIRRDAVCRDRDVAVAEELKLGRDEIVCVAVDRYVIPGEAIRVGRR